MKNLYAPWRESFIEQLDTDKKKAKKCLFCQKPPEKDDANNFILDRAKHCYVMLNLYPYNAGHLMVIPYRHCKDLDLLEEHERLDLMNATAKATKILKETLTPDGFNLGVNLGKGAGAGIPGHLHIHVVPRWNGDTNFMPILADTKHISFDLAKLYQKLYRAYHPEKTKGRLK